MEAVPRLHMLWFALKSSPEGTSFAILKKYIAEFYQEDPESYSKENIAEFYQEDPESYSKEVFALETLRNQAMRTTKDGSGVMKRYYCQLHSLQNRFPLLSESGIFTFIWKDLYHNNVNEVTDMRFELASVLFNIAASHTQSGASVTRGDVDGMKTACTHFQCAAWAFGELRERYANVNSGCDFMTAELLVFMQQVCYAQAQECILEKSLIDNRKPNIVAKVTAQIVVYYGAALAALLTGGDDGPVSQAIDANVYKLWKKYVRFKINYLHCILYLYQGQHAEEQRKMGERVTLYQAAWDKLEEARKESKGLPDQKEINESLVFTADVVEAKRKNAKNENEFIYHESVPELSTIGAVQGANLVNGISFSVSDPEVAGDDIFSRLVPMKAHEASSLYSEEKAKLLRKYGTVIEEKDTELTSYMSSLTLDNLNINEEKANKLPQGIVDRCAALNANKTAISDLIAAMSQLAEITADVEMNLKELSQILQQEEQDERDFQATTGVPRTPNPHITELTREYQKYLEAHTRAGESNNTLRKAMSLHVNNLKILALPLQEIQQKMPKLSAELNTAEIFKDVKLIVNKVNEMKAQRAQFHADLRIAVNEDDITAKVIAHGSDEGMQTLFDRELAKHERLTQLIEQNLLAQQNILQALTESYAKAAPVLKTLGDVKQKRENFFSSLAASYDVYEDLLAKSAKGLEFYKKLAGNVQKLLTRFKAARDVQSEERQQRQKSIAAIGGVQSSVKTTKSVSAGVPTPTPTVTGTPKLRDYLKAKNTSAATIAAAGVGSGDFKDANAAPAAGSFPSPPTATGFVPPVRPVPVGSENPTQAACSGNGSYYSGGAVAPNEPPPPYSLQQQQYYDPAAAGYTNPMYQQEQQNIAPPAYKFRASPNSQFNNINANMANVSLQANYARQEHNSQQAQASQNPYATNYNYTTNQYSTATGTTNPTVQTSSVYNYQQQQQAPAAISSTTGTVPQQQQFYNPTADQPLTYQVSSTPTLSSTQPLYVATANQHEQISQPPQLPYGYDPKAQQQMSAAIQEQQQQQLLLQEMQKQRALESTFLQQQAAIQQQQLATLQQQQQQQAALQQQQQAILQQQQQHQATLQQQQQAAFQQQQVAIQNQQQQLQPPVVPSASSLGAIPSPAPLPAQIPTVAPSLVPLSTQQPIPTGNSPYAAQQQQQTPNVVATPPPSMPSASYANQTAFPQPSPKSVAAQTNNTASPQQYASSATNHPGYRFNPQTGTYDYGSGYQQDNKNAATPHFGQFTYSQTSSLVGTTDSESANKMNLATGFNSPIISHAKAGAAIVPPNTVNPATEACNAANEDQALNYYTPPYGYHSSGSTAHQTTLATPQQQQQQQQKQQQQQQQQPTQQFEQQQVLQQQHQKDHQQQQLYSANSTQKSLYIQSGSSSIATTQTTKSSSGYASTAQHTPTGLDSATSNVKPTPVPVAKPTAANVSKQGSNIDLLSDIDFSGSDLNVPPPILPQPVLQPQVVTTPPASLVAASTAEPVAEQPQLKSPVKIAAPAAAASQSDAANIIIAAVSAASVPLQLTSPLQSPAALHKSSLDNLSNCSDLSSLENFDWDSVSVTHSTNEKHSTATAPTFQMQPYDPFEDEKTLNYFHKEVERYEKAIDSLNVKMLNGHTQLTAKWKELQVLIAKDNIKRTTTIAKLFPEKNRSLDCLPYDHARVKLDKNTDDYINAAYLKNLGAGCPNLIVAQTPQQNTLNDFWSMIWSQKARTVICLHTANEMLDPYWPQTLERQLHYDDFTVKCVQLVNLSHSTEYQLKLSMHGADPIIDLSILQIKQWCKALPTEVVGIASNALQTHQQRCLSFNAPASPLIMNCLTGSERSELVAIGICAVVATQCKRPILINVIDVWSRICAQRQNSLRDTAGLEQSMQIVLSHAHDVLNKRGIMTSYQVKIAPQVNTKEQQELKDPLNELDALWKLK